MCSICCGKSGLSKKAIEEIAESLGVSLEKDKTVKDESCREESQR
ncbi:MAG: hypothetical protein WC938_03295 [Candidatus Paceibacterota bacterium]|jgi:hypothetical protein